MERMEHMEKKFNFKDWWLYLLSGLVLSIAGVFLLFNPLASYAVVSMLFVVSLFISGAIEVIFAAANREDPHGWGGHLVTGIISLFASFVLLFYPLLTLEIIPLIMGFWLMFRGAMQMMLSMELTKHADAQWGWLFAAGAALSIFAIIIIVNPAFGAVTAVGLASAGFLATGILNIIYGYRIRELEIKEAMPSSAAKRVM